MKQRKNRFWKSVVGLMMVGLLLSGCAVGTDTWYARIRTEDQSEHDNTGGMPFDFSGAGQMDYSCTLTAWNEEGDRTELTFGTDDPIADGTWLQIETQALRGVMSWKTLSDAEVPAEVRTKILEDRP